MKLSIIERIRTEDVPADQRKWMSPIIGTINKFFSDVLSVINGGLTINDNMNAKLKTYNYVGGSELSIKNPLSVTPIGVIIAGVRQDARDPTEITDPISIYWEYDGQNIVVKSITGLSANVRYNLTLLILGG